MADRELSYGEAVVSALSLVMATTPEALIFGGAWIGAARDRDVAWTGFAETFADRICYPPISELAVVGMGIGAAMAGMRPLVNLGMASFAFQSWPQLVNEAPNIHYLTGGRCRVPLVVHVFGGGRPGSAAQHTHHLEASLWNVPGLEIAVPATPRDAAGLLLAAVESENPTVFISHLGLLDTLGPVSDPPSLIELGHAEIKRSGRDVTIVAVSIMVPRALEAAETLAAAGVDAEVLDVRCLVPFDHAMLLESVEKTGRLVIAEEGQLSCGVGAEIAAIVSEKAFGSLRAPIRRVAVPDCPIPASPRLKALVEPGSAEIAAAVSSLVGLTGAPTIGSDLAGTEI